MKILQKPLVILSIIVLLGVLLRIYKLEIFYPFGHDQDLWAWIAKDIVVDHHIRLIGQETSITGVFIGPLFYYLIALCLIVFNMNPLGAAVLTTVISLFTIISIYWVFKKFFGNYAGLIGGFLYAISPGTIFLDRWVVPTQPTILWSVWFLYILLSILKGNFNVLIPFSILIGLIWHIHIAFIPLLILLPVAFFLSRKMGKIKYSWKNIVTSLLILLIFTAPFFIFEIRHNFGQTNSLINAVFNDHDNLAGINRLIKVFDSGGRSLIGAFLLSGPTTLLSSKLVIFLPALLLIAILYLMFCKVLTKGQTTLFVIWFLIVILGQFFSKRIITEYYFNNLFVILFLTLTLLLIKLNNLFKNFPIVFILLTVYLLGISVWFIKKPDDLGGYLYKEQVLQYIKQDSQTKDYPCIAINFIEKPPVGSGWRYLYWYYKLNVISGGNNIAVYSIVNPWTTSSREIEAKFGNLGVIVPAKGNIDSSLCSKADRQLLPLWGFTN